jgi:hypothetical protein
MQTLKIKYLQLEVPMGVALRGPPQDWEEDTSYVVQQVRVHNARRILSYTFVQDACWSALGIRTPHAINVSWDEFSTSTR